MPGWTSQETLVSFEERVLPLEPDVVVVYHGRNDLFPQAFRGFRADYSHYRHAAGAIPDPNALHRRLFRCSRLLLLACTWRGERFGFERRFQTPVYCSIRYENQPDAEELRADLESPLPTAAYRAHLERIVTDCRARGVAVVLCTMAFREGELVTGNLERPPRDALRAQLDRNNQVVRAVAAEQGSILVETAALAERAELFLDDCHATAEGHRLQAEMVLEGLLAGGLIDRGPGDDGAR